jgi:hypothetical protein
LFSSARLRKIMASNFTNQAIMSQLRGKGEEAFRFIQHAVQLLDTSAPDDLSQSTQSLSIYALSSLLQGKISQSQKLWRQTKKLMLEQALDPVTLSYVQLYSSIHHLCLGEFSQAECELTVNRTLKIDTMGGLIPCCCKLLEAWISFMCGNCRRVEILTAPSCLNGESSPELLLYDIWTRQLRVIQNTFRGNFFLAKRELCQLSALQSSSSKLSHSCLLSFLEFCENYSSATASATQKQQQQLIKRLIVITTKLSSSVSLNLLSIVLSYLVACCCGLLLEKIPRDHWSEEEKGMADPFISFILKVISQFNSISSTYHFVVVLKEVLEVKLFRLSLISQPSLPNLHLKKFLHSTRVTVEYFHQTPNTHNSISCFPDFTFGVTWWRVEMYKTSKMMNLNENVVQEYYQTAIDDLKKYNVPHDHPFSLNSLSL